jgi:hypothetical protein
MKNLAYDLAYLGVFWYTAKDNGRHMTFDYETKSVFLAMEVTGDWCCPWSSKPVWGR